MFNPLEVQNETASRDMRYKIQKWNLNSEKVHAILAANARVDWVWLLAGSTTEGASDVSPFHLFHFAYCTCRLSVWLWVLRVGGVWFCLFVSCVLHVQ